MLSWLKIEERPPQVDGRDDEPLGALDVERGIKKLEASWLTELREEFKKDYFKKLSEYLKDEYRRTVFPPLDMVHNWSFLCPFPAVKVVILGQDPYHNDGQAMGLSFSVPHTCKIPPSLDNIYKELKSDLGKEFTVPSHGCLVGWARQGVLLLNAALTVRAHEANSHAGKGWEHFTDSIIMAVNAKSSHPCVFMLWGSFAIKKGQRIDRKRHLVLEGVHPSPLSAHRGFFGCKHFSKADAHLEKHGLTPIDWSNLPTK
jgi:uracil-DNA glycosylase